MNKKLLFLIPVTMLFFGGRSIAQHKAIFFENFETAVTSTVPTGWSVIDADGDGKNWYALKDAGSPVIAGHSGTGFMTSASYATVALTPNNWLITPQITLTANNELTYWVNAQDAAYPAEKYGVYISTTGNTDVAAFTELFVETLTAKAVKNAGERGTNAQGTWYKRTISLAAYTGPVYIAFRHFDCTDMFRMNLDDVKVDAVSNAYTVSYDFEGQTVGALPTGWTGIDADGDGNQWQIGPTTFGPGHSGSGFVTSASWINQVPLTPDNWLISPKIALQAGCRLEYFVCAQDAAYPADKYGVFISTTNNTETSAFTQVFVETLTAKDYKPAGLRGTNVQGAWYKRTVDLSSYSGDIYIAFRHFDCTDNFWMNLDDVTITNEEVPTILPPETLTATADNDKAILKWSKVQGAVYNVFCGTVKIASKIADTTFTHANLVRGEYCYTVTSFAQDIESALSDEACVTIESDYIFRADFEELTAIGPMPAGWLTVDGNADNSTWVGIKNASLSYVAVEGHSGRGIIASYSGQNKTPNDWAITPQMDLKSDQALLTYYVSAMTATLAAEHYGVYISTTDTDTASFTLLFEETLSAKNALLDAGKSDEMFTMGREGAKAYPQRAWTGRQIDLSAYTGKVYIAFRHYNTTNQHYLVVDDVVVKVGSPYAFNAPENLTATVEGVNKVKLSWSAVEHADFYNLYCNEIFLKKLPSVARTFLHTGLLNGEYSYTVQAGNDFASSNNSAPAVVTISEAPIKLSEGFETTAVNAIPFNWTKVDADGDSNNWYTYSGVANNGSRSIASASWLATGGALTPDNWLITPAMTIGSGEKLTYFVRSSSYYGETYGLYISTTDTDTASFTRVVYEPQLKAGTWQPRVFDLADYEGQTIYIAFRHFNCTDGIRLYLDDIVVMGEVSCGTPENLQASASMSSVNLTWDAVSGASLYTVCQVIDENTSIALATVAGTSYTVQQISNGTYQFAVKATCEYAVSPLSAPVSVEVTESVLIFAENFESVINNGNPPAGWTRIDADADGQQWYASKTTTAPGHSGTGFMTSASYASYVALTPDNWLITPQLTLTDNNELVYWVCAQDAAYPAEKYGVYISTTNNTDTAAFHQLFVETLTAKTAKNAGARGTNAQGTWYQRTISLADYTGSVYIAFRHFDCTDFFRMNLDDVQVLKQGAGTIATPTGLAVDVNADVVEISWDAVEHATHYVIYNVTNESDLSVLTNNVTGTSFTVNGLADGNYCYAVRAIGEFAQSDVCAKVCATINAGRTTVYFEDFESITNNGYINGWQIVDADGDGFYWYGSNVSDIIGHSGTGFMTSASYSGKPLTPDNWLISPKITLGAWNNTLSYYIGAQDAKFANEYYAVYISSSDDNIESFEQKIAESLGAKGDRGSERGRAQGTWMRRSVDLSAYSGEIYVAFRHFNTYGQFRINLDDIAIVASPTAIEDNTVNSVKVYPVPARNVLNVTTNKTHTSYDILNIVGQVVSSSAVTSSSFQVNTADLTRGIYFIRLNGNGIPSVAKFIVE